MSNSSCQVRVDRGSASWSVRAQPSMGRLSWLFPARLQDSFFAAEFVTTTTQTSQTTMHAAGQTVADWPADQMKAYLRDSRSWGTWIVENDQLSRQMVAALLAAHEETGCLAEDDEEAGQMDASHAALPHMGERRRTPTKGDDWLAPHVVSQLAGILLQHGCVPAESAALLNLQLSSIPGPSRIGIALLVGGNCLMWVMLFLDLIAHEEWRYELAVWPADEGARGLVGIGTMWLCHADVGHLTGNTFGWLAFGLIILLGHGPKTLFALFLGINFVVGVTCWLTRGGCGASLTLTQTPTLTPTPTPTRHLLAQWRGLRRLSNPSPNSNPNLKPNPNPNSNPNPQP